MMRTILFVLAAFLGGMSFAATLDASLIQTSGDPAIGTGKFYGYRTPQLGPGDAAFDDALALAKEERVPLVVIWSHEDCHFCDSFIQSLNNSKSAVQNWMKQNRAVFAFFKATGYEEGYAGAGPGITEPKACLDAWDFVSNTCGSEPVWPLIGFYSVRADGTDVTWRHGDIENKTFSWLKQQFADWKEKNHIGASAGGGAFAVEGSEGDRYEAEAATRYADVTLVREAGNAFGDVKNTLYAFWPGENGPYLTTNFTWSAGETSRCVRVTLTHGAFPGAGEKIALRLSDAWGNLLDETPIACLSPATSASNPKWIGEDFGFGEWTMDLGAAKELVAGTDGAAYTVVSMQGSKWCPDCANVDRNFLDVTNAAGENVFCAWAASNHVALVTIDIPNFTDTEGSFASPTLLSRRAATSTLARPKEYPQSGADVSLTEAAVRSGVGYLTRKGVDDGTAAECLARNHFLAVANTDEGGFHRPEDTNQKRTGVPIFVVLRKDGTVAARLTRMASVSPMAADRANVGHYLKRFDEMLALAAGEGGHADIGEIANNFPDAGAATVSIGGAATNELCNADFQDSFRIDGFGGGMHARAVAFGESDAEVLVSIVTTNELGKMVTLATASGVLSEVVAVDAALAENADYFVQVKGADITSDAFKLESSATNHFHSYTLWPDALLVPTDRTSEARAPAGSDRVVMRIASNEVYRLDGFAEPDGSKLRWISEATYPMTGDLYMARVSDDVELRAETTGGRIEFQRWRPGQISFASESSRVIEHAGTGTVIVARTDGGSCAESVIVRCVAQEEGAEGRYAWVDQEVSWADGETGTKEVGFVLVGDDVYQPDATFTLALFQEEPAWSALIAPTNHVVSICDTDAPCFEHSVYAVEAIRSFSSERTFKVVNVSEGGRISVKCTSGTKLPTGMTIKYDETTGEIVLSGVPTKAGTYAFDCVVTEHRRSGLATGFVTRITVVVDEPAATNPYAAKARPTQKLALYEAHEDGDWLVGYLDVAITSLGRISAKCMGVTARTVSFAGTWEGFDGSAACATLTARSGEKLALRLDDAGTLSAELDGTWSAVADWPETGVFSDYAGYYTATLATNGVQEAVKTCGTACLSLTMTTASAVRNGTVRFAGTLADGTSVSGTTTLRNVREAGAEIPAYVRNSRNVFGASIFLAPGGAEKWSAASASLREVVTAQPGTVPYVRHTEAGETSVSRREVTGVWYKQGIAPATLYETFYYGYEAGTPFLLDFADHGAGVVRVSGKRLVLDRTSGLSFSFVPRTGMFAGSARLEIDGKRVSGCYRGMVIPGWVNSCACGDVAPERPFGGGMFWYRERVGGKSLLRSLPVVLDIAAPAGE